MLETYRPLLQQALARSPEGFTVDDLEREISEGRALLWAGKDSAVVGYMRPFRAMHVWAAGGSLSEIRTMDAEVEKLSRALGCDAMLAGGRPGWARALGWDAYALKEVRT